MSWPGRDLDWFLNQAVTWFLTRLTSESCWCSGML